MAEKPIKCCKKGLSEQLQKGYIENTRGHNLSLFLNKLGSREADTMILLTLANPPSQGVMSMQSHVHSAVYNYTRFNNYFTYYSMYRTI